MTDLALWTLDQAKRNCNVLSSVGEHLPLEYYSQFLFVPYKQFSTKTEPMKRYQAKVGNIAVFLVRIDSTDLRHVLVGFLNSFDRERFLKTKDIVLRRPQPR